MHLVSENRISASVLLSALALALLAAVGCEAHTTVLTPIRLPHHRAPAREQLHVGVVRAYSFSARLRLPDGKCPSYAAMKSPRLQGTLVAVKDGFRLKQTAIPSVPEFCVAAWYDANGNGKIDAGDGVGHFVSPFPAQPSRFFSSNRYTSPPVVLRQVP